MGQTTNGKCQHKLRSWKFDCSHGFKRGTSCELCMLACAQCHAECGGNENWPLDKILARVLSAAVFDVKASIVREIRKRADRLGGYPSKMSLLREVAAEIERL